MSALKRVGISCQQFYDTKRKDPELATRYDQIKRDRGDMASEEPQRVLQELECGLEEDAHRGRVRAEIAQKIASMYDPEKYGNRVNITSDIGPNIIASMSAASLRLPPGRDLAQIVDAEYVAIPPLSPAQATDKQSAEWKEVFDED